MKGGYRCFLDEVRNTAEMHQIALLNVEQHIWGTERDTMSQVRAIGRSMAQCEIAILKGETAPLDFGVVEINPSIFFACANAIRLWLEGTAPNPMNEFVIYDLETITLPATASPDKALSLMGGPLFMGDAHIRPPKKRGRKAAPSSVQAEELRLYCLKQKPEYRDYQDLEKDVHIPAATLRKIVNRVGHRLLREKDRQSTT